MNSDQTDLLIAPLRELRRQRTAKWNCGLSSLRATANGIGLRGDVRSSLTLVGGNSPQDAWLVPTQSENIEGLLADLNHFIESNLDADVHLVVGGFSYQFIQIHPLSDGNGRLVRFLLLVLAQKLSSAYPIYLCWLHIFHKRMVGASWVSAREQQCFGSSSSCYFDFWLGLVAPLVNIYRDLEARGVDRRVVSCLAAFGKISPHLIRQVDRACGDALSEKIYLKSLVIGGIREGGGFGYSEGVCVAEEGAIKGINAIID